MPRNVRNFWMDAHIDGRTTMLSGGPVRKDGGFELRVHQRDDGMVHRDVLTVWGTAADDGTLRLHIDLEGEEVATFTTHRDRPIHEAGLDTVSSASRQHWIDTGRYLTHEETAETVREEIDPAPYAVHRGIAR